MVYFEDILVIGGVMMGVVGFLSLVFFVEMEFVIGFDGV